MGATFIHLSGSKRGEVESLAEELVKVGTGEDCNLRFDFQSDAIVAPLHAEIRFENCEYILSDKEQGTFVNNRMVPEIILQDGDIIEFGTGGPKVRFRIRPEDRSCKPFREICADCFDRTMVASANRLVALPRFLKIMLREVYREASWKARTLLFSSLFLIAGSILASPLFFYKSYVDRLHYERSLFRLSREVQSDRLSRKDLERVLHESRRQFAEYRAETGTALAQLREQRERLQTRLKESGSVAEQRAQAIRDLETRLNAASLKIRDLERDQRAGEKVIQKNMGGVAFIEVTYTWEDEVGRRVRFLGLDSSGQPLRDVNGEAQASVEGQGPVLQIRTSGTGFLVRPGELLTNRHVAEPWLENNTVRPMVEAGFHPVRVVFRAFFPGIPEPYPLRLHRVSDTVDVALVRFDQRGEKLPVLELDSRPTSVAVGRPVILIGYPVGIKALLARVDPSTLEEIFETEGDRVDEITAELSRRGLIRPLTTWGHLSELQPHLLTYDALTTVGGSGSPILNAKGGVIGINQAVLLGFAGSNFGIPSRLAEELMSQG